MQFTKDILSEKNYSGVRRIPVKSPMIKKYKDELDKLQKQIQPNLKKMEDMSKILDPHYAKINEYTEKINKVKAEMAGTLEQYNIELAKVEVVDKKAQAVKNKLQPIIDKLIEGELGEFERPTNLITEKGFHFVEVIDELEEYIKAKRARTQKK